MTLTQLIVYPIHPSAKSHPWTFVLIEERMPNIPAAYLTFVARPNSFAFNSKSLNKTFPVIIAVLFCSYT